MSTVSRLTSSRFSVRPMLFDLQRDMFEVHLPEFALAQQRRLLIRPSMEIFVVQRALRHGILLPAKLKDYRKMQAA